MPPRISFAGPSHGPLLARLHGKCFANPWSDNDFAQLLAMPGAFAKLACLVDKQEENPVGFAVARTAGGECEIITIGVMPSHRSLGVGGRLITAIATDCMEFEFDSILLEVAEDNRSALKLLWGHRFRGRGAAQKLLSQWQWRPRGRYHYAVVALKICVYI